MHLTGTRTTMLRQACLWSAPTFSARATAADGDIDATFGTLGLARIQANDLALMLGIGAPPAMPPVIQPDGKILVCATVASGDPSGKDFLVARFMVDGHLDSTFNFDGTARIDFDNGMVIDYCS
jgi:hypothetical protein